MQIFPSVRYYYAVRPVRPLTELGTDIFFCDVTRDGHVKDGIPAISDFISPKKKIPGAMN